MSTKPLYKLTGTDRQTDKPRYYWEACASKNTPDPYGNTGEHFEERNRKIHNGMLLVAEAYQGGVRWMDELRIKLEFGHGLS